MKLGAPGGLGKRRVSRTLYSAGRDNGATGREKKKRGTKATMQKEARAGERKVPTP